jgi:hypothetical protein
MILLAWAKWTIRFRSGQGVAQRLKAAAPRFFSGGLGPHILKKLTPPARKSPLARNQSCRLKVSLVNNQQTS